MVVPAAVIAVVRSLVQALIANLMSAAWFVAGVDWLNTSAGTELTVQTIETAAFTVAFGLVVLVTNWLGKQEKFQWLNKVISLWLSNSAAVYDKSTVAGGDGVPDTEVDMGGEEGVFGE